MFRVHKKLELIDYQNNNLHINKALLEEVRYFEVRLNDYYFGKASLRLARTRTLHEARIEFIECLKPRHRTAKRQVT
jgi:hypothetical protein